jgi:hypothetical protein
VGSSATSAKRFTPSTWVKYPALLSVSSGLAPKEAQSDRAVAEAVVEALEGSRILRPYRPVGYAGPIEQLDNPAIPAREWRPRRIFVGGRSHRPRSFP